MPIRKDAFFSVAGTDVSNDVMNLSVPRSFVTNDNTKMGSNIRRSEAGLASGSISGTIEGDADGRSASEVAFHDVFKTEAKTAALIYRNDSAAASATNRQLSFTGVLSSFELGASASGDKIMWNFTFQLGGSITEATS